MISAGVPSEILTPWWRTSTRLESGHDDLHDVLDQEDPGTMTHLPVAGRAPMGYLRREFLDRTPAPAKLSPASSQSRGSPAMLERQPSRESLRSATGSTDGLPGCYVKS